MCLSAELHSAEMANKEDFSIDNLIPEEEAVSGMHEPSGDNLWTVPSMGEENLKKDALGLTSIPQSINGGELLQLPGAPQPPGLSREVGDDEETDFFGANDDSFSFHPRNDEKVIDKKEKPSKAFFDFLFTNKSEINENSGEEKGIKMKALLENLENSLKKIGAIEKDENLVALAAVPALILEIPIALVGLGLYHYLKDPKVPREEKNSAQSVADELNKIMEDGKKLGLTLEDFKDMINGRKEEQLLLQGVNRRRTQKGEPSHSDEDGQKILALLKRAHAIAESLKETSKSHAVTEEQPKVPVDRTTIAKGWGSYATSDIKEKVKKAWDAWVAANPDAGYDASFYSWVAWYKAEKNKAGKDLSPEEVISALQLEEKGPTGQPPTAEAGEGAEDTPAEESPVDTREALVEFLTKIEDDTKIVGLLGVRHRRAKRQIRRAGGPESAAIILLRNKDYSSLNNKPGSTRDRGGKKVHTLSPLQDQAVKDLLSREERKRRRRQRRRERRQARKILDRMQKYSSFQ